MFDFDAGKLVVIGVVALIVIGPKDLPRVLRQVGQAVSKLRRMASDFQSQFMDAMREADLEDIRKDVASLNSAAKLDTRFNPLDKVRRELNEAMADKRPVETPAPPAPPAVEATETVHAAVAASESAMAPAPAEEPHPIGGA